MFARAVIPSEVRRLIGESISEILLRGFVMRAPDQSSWFGLSVSSTLLGFVEVKVG